MKIGDNCFSNHIILTKIWFILSPRLKKKVKTFDKPQLKNIVTPKKKVKLIFDHGGKKKSCKY
jgi:hypothetical protein